MVITSVSVLISCQVSTVRDNVGVRMKLLVLILMAVLDCSLLQGRIVSKCELRKKMTDAINDLTKEGKHSGLKGVNTVAKREFSLFPCRDIDGDSSQKQTMVQNLL